MKQTIEIEVPEGKKAIWKDGRVYFIDDTLKLPKTWKEFCMNYPIKNGEGYINNCSAIEYSQCGNRYPHADANTLPSLNAAYAHLALMQLHQLRDCYRQGWKPDWKNTKIDKYCVVNCEGLFVTSYTTYVRFLSFQSEEVAKIFLNNFRDLIEQARDLI